MFNRMGFAWLMIGVGMGLVAQRLLSKSHEERNPWDVDGVLKACDKAAAKLEKITERQGSSWEAAS